jgi:hypothetical protein
VTSEVTFGSPQALSGDRFSGAARVSGSGALVFPAGYVLGVLQTGVGVYEVELAGPLSDAENIPKATPITSFAMNVQAVADWLSPTVVIVRTMVWDLLTDCDFFLEIEKVRTGPATIPSPTPGAFIPPPVPFGAVPVTRLLGAGTGLTGGTVDLSVDRVPLFSVDFGGAPPAVAAASSSGIAATVSRSDHTHEGVHSVGGGNGIVAGGTALDRTFAADYGGAPPAIAAASSSGIAATVSRSDHTHEGVHSASGGNGIVAGGTALDRTFSADYGGAPPAVAAASAAGVATTLSRSDHTHEGVHSASGGNGIVAGGTALDRTFSADYGGAPPNVALTSSAGVATTLSRSDHTHALDQTQSYAWTGSQTWGTSTTPVAITQGAAAAGALPIGFAYTGGAHTTLTVGSAYDWSLNFARTVQFTAGATIAELGAIRVQPPTYAATGAQTITAAATIIVTGAPAAGGGTPPTFGTLVNGTHAIWTQAGNWRIDSGDIKLNSAGSTTNIRQFASAAAVTIQGNIAAGNAAADVILNSTATRTAGNIAVFQNNGNTRLGVVFHGGLTLAQGIATSGTAQMLSLTGGAHTGQTSGEINFVDVNQGTVTWTNGSFATQRCYRFRAPTLAMTSGAPGGTITTAVTVEIDDAPQVGASAAITTAIAFRVNAGSAQFKGNMGFFSATPAAQQTSGANLTNNVTAGGADDTIANFTSLTVYATDAAAIRNDIYQLARKLKQINDGLRTYGLFT